MGQVPDKDGDENSKDNVDFLDDQASSSSFISQSNLFHDISDFTLTKFRDPEVQNGIQKRDIPDYFRIPIFDKNGVIITVKNPRKIGSGINAYVLYQVCTKNFSKQSKLHDAAVERRFRDFFALNDSFIANYKPLGHLVVPPPEKSVVGSTLVKMTKEVSYDFIEKRRSALERYLNRIIKNPFLNKDRHFEEFLELDELPEAEKHTSVMNARPSIVVIDMVKNVQEALVSRTTETEEGGIWFQNKQQLLSKLSSQFQVLHNTFNVHFDNHQSVAVSLHELGQSFSTLGNLENHPLLSGIFIELSSVFAKLSLVDKSQSDSDHYNVGEMFNDHLKIIIEINNLFDMRHKMFQKWQSAISDVQKKRKSVTEFNTADNTDAAKLQRETDQLQVSEISKKQAYYKFSTVAKDDIVQYGIDLSAELNQAVLIFLNNMIKSHETNLQIWEAFLQIVS